ncbi:MFS transporter [Nonomuraea sp. NPDC050691]|uniref:MFS transporter n=1 Tax=Nonomuraea sp. NPDC050691 TaxID=3155661 RepID=UPI0033DE189D
MPSLGRAFTFLLSSTALSNVADGVLKVGAPLLAISMTRSPTQVSLVGAAVTLPWLLFALHAGAIADRLDRRRIMVLANAARAGVLVLGGALAVSGMLNLWGILGILLVAGVSEVFADTSAQSVLPMTVPSDRLTAANGRVVSVQMIGNEFLGSPLAGFLVTLLPVAVLGAPALLYGAAGVLLLGMRGNYSPVSRTIASSADPQAASADPRAGSSYPQAAPATPHRGGLGRDIREALRYLWAHRFLRTLAISAGLLNTASAAYFGVLILWLVGPGSRVGLTPEGYGLMMSALAAGSVAGSLVAERLTGLLGEGRTLVACWLVSALLYLVPVLVPVGWLLYPTAVVWGLVGGASNVLVVSTRQRLIPSALLGRVNSAYRLIGMGGMPVGAALGGLLGEIAGLPAVFLGAAGVCLAAVGLVWRVARDPISMPLTSDHSVRRTSASL